MISALKIFTIGALTIFILCLNFNGKPLFEPLYSVVSHISVPVQNATESLFEGALRSGQDYSKKIFNNSVPKVRDAVKSRVSAPIRISRSGHSEPKEVILSEEKEELDELIKGHH
jgi:hypothetical protein